MFGDRFSSSTSCSRWLYETEPGRLDQSLSCRFLKVATHPSELLPRVHRVAALLKRWLIGTHQGAVSREHLDYYLDEYTFRFNRRRSRHRGKLFYRLVQQAAAVGPTTYSEMVQHVRGRRISRPQDMG